MNLLKNCSLRFSLIGMLLFSGFSAGQGQNISPDLYTDSTMTAGDRRTYYLFDIGGNQDIYMKIYGYDFNGISYFNIKMAIDTSKIRWVAIWDSTDKKDKGFLPYYGSEKNILNNNTTKGYYNNVQEKGANSSDERLTVFTLECLLYPPVSASQETHGDGLMGVIHFRTASNFTTSDTAGITIIAYDIRNAAGDYRHYSRKYLYSTINYYSPLPVTLQAFEARESENGSISIEWEILEASNIFGYSVERSYKKGEFAEISFVSDPVRNGEVAHFAYVDTEAKGEGIYYYRLKIVEIDGKIQYSEAIQIEVKLPDTFSLYQNYPNPFNEETRITFSLPEEMQIDLKIYDVAGRLVRTVLSGRMNGGNHIVHVSSEKLASGTYFYRLTGGTLNRIMKMSVIK